MGKRRTARLPRCIKCDVSMTVVKVKVELIQAERLRYERRTFQCPDCAHQQTYTMGLTEQTS